MRTSGMDVSKNGRHRVVVVRARAPGCTIGSVGLGELRWTCALGRSGRRVRKREGDGATPVGTFAFVRVLYRADRALRPLTRLPVAAIRTQDGWCDAPRDRNYNRPVTLPYPSSAERMCRDDGLYDIVIVLSHNQRPRVRGAGSAVFVHLARPGYLPTEGCIALAEPDLRNLLARLRRGDRIRILP